MSNVTADGGGVAPSSDPVGWMVGGVAAAAVTAAQLVATYGAQSVKVEVETLTEFKKRAEELLSALQSSPAAVSQLSQLQLYQDNLGSGFAESTDLMSAYNRAFNNLPQLVAALGTQIDGMNAALGQTAASYGDTEEQQVSAAKAVQGQTGSYTMATPAVYTGNMPVAAPNPPPVGPVAGSGSAAF